MNRLLVCYRPLAPCPGGASEGSKAYTRRGSLPGAGGRLIAARQPLRAPRAAHAC